MELPLKDVVFGIWVWGWVILLHFEFSLKKTKLTFYFAKINFVRWNKMCSILKFIFILVTLPFPFATQQSEQRKTPKWKTVWIAVISGRDKLWIAWYKAWYFVFFLFNWGVRNTASQFTWTTLYSFFVF